ncbi:MAG: VWA domain-containing protein, partial [Thermoanaerobaculia bacterium]
AHSGRIALVAFESTAEILSPLTSDTDAVATLIGSLSAGELAAPGSDIGSAVIAALSMVDAEPAQRTDVIVISDGEEQGTSIAVAADRAKARNATVSSILLGSRGGSTIPTAKGPMRDESGQPITTFARPDALQALASRTGGVVLENPFAEGALDPLLARPDGARSRQTQVRVPVDRYQWPLAFAFVLLLGASLLNRGAE